MQGLAAKITLQTSMTAEIAIINRSGIALAADSAATIGRRRVWTGTNKIFSLGPHHDIALMFYGSADFLGTPWEIIFKEYKKVSRRKEYSSIRQCKEDFLAYIVNRRFLSEFQEELSISTLFNSVLVKIERQISALRKEDHSVSTEDALEFALPKVESEIINREVFLDLEYKIFSKRYRSRVKEFILEIIADNVSLKKTNRIVKMMYESFRRKVDSEFGSGIVFAGYGSDELLPTITHCAIDGYESGVLRCWGEADTSFSNSRIEGAYVLAFARHDISVSFMEGANPRHRSFFAKAVEGVLEAKSSDIVSRYVGDEDERIVELAIQRRDNRKIVDALMDEHTEFTRKVFSAPIMQVISSLPKEEMCAMAEALVDVTALRSKMDSAVASVSGPIDVAFVSKCDGVVWIKRKHYFDIDLNIDFKYRRNLPMREGESDA